MIQTGDIIFVKGNTWVSPLIRWFTGSPYTHVALAINEQLILEIDRDKDLAIRVNRHENVEIFRYKRGLTKEQQLLLKERIIHQLTNNQGYDWLRVIRFFCEKLFRTKKAFHDTQKMVCSEIVDVLYYELGIDLVPNREIGDVTPGHLRNSDQLIQVH